MGSDIVGAISSVHFTAGYPQQGIHTSEGNLYSFFPFLNKLPKRCVRIWNRMVPLGLLYPSLKTGSSVAAILRREKLMVCSHSFCQNVSQVLSPSPFHSPTLTWVNEPLFSISTASAFTATSFASSSSFSTWRCATSLRKPSLQSAVSTFKGFRDTAH